MTYCCNNIQRAYELMGNAKNRLDWSPRGYNVGDFLGQLFTLNVSSISTLTGFLKESGSRMVDAYNILCEARNAINACNCESSKNFWKDEENKERQRANNLVNEYNNLSNSSREKYNSLINDYNNLSSNSRERYNTLAGEWNELKDKYNNFIDKYNDLARNSVSKESAERLEAEYRKNIADYNELIGKYSGLQESRNDLSRRFDRLNEDFEEMKDKNENLRDKIDEERQIRHLEELRNARTEERLRGEALAIRGELGENRLRLADSQNQVLRLKNNLGESNQEVKNLTNRMTTLQLESNNQNNELQQTNRELVRIQEERDERIDPLELQELLTSLYQREEEINSLKSRLNQAEEGKLTQKLRSEENRLEKNAKRLGIDWDIIQALRDNYEGLIRARKDYNRDEIKNCQDNIEILRQSLLGSDIDTDDLQEVAEKCEKVAELRIELEQQLEARIEVPLNNN